MTKTYLHILAVVAALLTLAACGKEDTEPKAVSDRPSFSATIVGEGTRAHDTSWDTGDLIGISVKSGNVSGGNVTGGGASNLSHTHQGNGAFKVTKDAEQIIFTDNTPVKFTAYYPYGTPSTNASYLGKIATYATANISQTNQKKFDFLWADEAEGSKTNPDVKFEFSHKMSKISFVFVSDDIDVNAITKLGIKGFILRGTFDPKSGDCEAIPNGSTTTTTSVNVTNGKPETSLIMFPQTLKATVELTITATSVGIGTIMGTLTFKDNKIESGKHYQLRVRVSKSELTVEESSINEWNPVSVVPGENQDIWEAW